MSIISRMINNSEPVINPVTDNQKLTIDELEFLLNCLKNTMLKGDQIEMFYNLVIKLQTQYIEQTK